MAAASCVCVLTCVHAARSKDPAISFQYICVRRVRRLRAASQGDTEAPLARLFCPLQAAIGFRDHWPFLSLSHETSICNLAISFLLKSMRAIFSSLAAARRQSAADASAPPARKSDPNSPAAKSGPQRRSPNKRIRPTRRAGCSRPLARSRSSRPLATQQQHTRESQAVEGPARARGQA